MTDSASDTSQFLSRHRRGVPGAADELLAHTCARLQHLTSRMLRGYPTVSRWEETGDVFQNACIRLRRALADVTPDSPRHYYNLALLQIRRELLDLADKYTGTLGIGANHHTDGAGKAPNEPGGPLDKARAEDGEPGDIEAWAEFHRRVGELPADELELFGLIWYEGLTQQQASEVLGVSLRTVKRRWQSARLLLSAAMGGESP